MYFVDEIIRKRWNYYLSPPLQSTGSLGSDEKSFFNSSNSQDFSQLFNSNSSAQEHNFSHAVLTITPKTSYLWRLVENSILPI